MEVEGGRGGVIGTVQCTQPNRFQVHINSYVYKVGIEILRTA